MGGTHVRQGTQLSKRAFSGLAVSGTTVPLLLHNLLAVPMVIVPVQGTDAVQIFLSILQTGPSVALAGLGHLD